MAVDSSDKAYLLKKIPIPGFLRRLARKPYACLRKGYGSCKSFCNQCYEVSYLLRGSYAPGHPDNKFFDTYYSSERETSGQDEPKRGVVFMCDGRQFHGGLTDRLRGLLTTYREAKKRKLPFFIYWHSPFYLKDYFMPASFDWDINANELSFDPRNAFPVIIDDEPDLQSGMRMAAGLQIKKRQLHVYSNADNARGEYKKLFSELFRPSPKLQENISFHLSKLGEKYEAFTFRFLNLLGDFKEWNNTSLDDQEAQQLMEKVFKEFYKLTSHIPLSEKILVTSDSRRFLDFITDADPRVYVVNGDVKNIDLEQGSFPDAWLKTFTDQHLLMGARKVTLMRTEGMYKSGFPRFAAEVGGTEYSDHKF